MIDMNFCIVFSNDSRRKIWEIIRNSPKSFTQLKNDTKLSDGSLAHHLRIMEESGLINKEIVKENNKFKAGKEVKISPNLLEFKKRCNKR